MFNPSDITNKPKLPNSKQHELEKEFQKDELSYLSAEAFESFNVSNEEIEHLNQLIDEKTKSTKGNTFSLVFVSLLFGLLIGISVFFVIFHKNKNHQSVFQLFNEEPTTPSLNNQVSKNDTLFPEIKPSKTEHDVEHYATMNETADVQVEETIQPDMMTVNTSSLTVDEEELNRDLKLQFIPNAPVIFISGLKVTNYKIYYFKSNASISLSSNSGLEARFERGNMVSKNTAFAAEQQFYVAHKIIKRAMSLFSNKKYLNCIEELTLLYNYNNNDANAQFYLGMCYFYTGKYAQAKNYFQKDIDNENNIFHQESEFYLAQSLLLLNELPEAKQLLVKVSEDGGFYAQRAKDILDKEVKLK